MKAAVILSFCVLLASTGDVLADANVVLKPPRVYTGPQPPAHKPSSLAPTPGGTRRRTYGAPIQGRIFRMQPKPQLRSQPLPASKPR